MVEIVTSPPAEQM